MRGAFLGVRFPVLVPVATAKEPTRERDLLVAIGHAHLPAVRLLASTRAGGGADALARSAESVIRIACAGARIAWPRELLSPAASLRVIRVQQWVLDASGRRAGERGTGAAMDDIHLGRDECWRERAVDERGQR